MASQEYFWEENLSISTKTGSKKLLLTTEPPGGMHRAAAEASGVMAKQVPSVQNLLLLDGQGASYMSASSREMGDDETVVILYSSGTTGPPKPVPIKAGVVRTSSNLTSMPVPEGRQNITNVIYGTELLFSGFLGFHGIIVVFMIRCIYYRRPICLPQAVMPATAEFLVDAIAAVRPTVLACPAFILEAICTHPNGFEALSTLDAVLYGGTVLDPSFGDKISRVTRLLSDIGSTETFNHVAYVPLDPADWQYFEWNPHGGAVMERTATDPKVAEMVIRRVPGSEYQAVFHNFPGRHEWRTGDLYKQHLTKPTLWKYIGRATDTVVLNSGEWIYPLLFETSIQVHPWVQGALLVGTGQSRPGLLIEPIPDQSAVSPDAFIDEIWSTLEEADTERPAHARVSRSMVTLATPDKPLPRNRKKMIIRQAAYRLYEEEIRHLYQEEQEEDT